MRPVIRSAVLTALLVTVVGAASCARATSAGLPEITLGTDAAVRAGGAVRVAGTPVTIAVERIDESRCPADATCVRAGEARVMLRCEGGVATRSDTLEVGATAPVTRCDRYAIMLVDVRPYPRSTDRERVPVAVLRVTVPE